MNFHDGRDNLVTQSMTPAPSLQTCSNSGGEATSKGCIRARAVVPADDRIRHGAGFELACASATKRNFMTTQC